MLENQINDDTGFAVLIGEFHPAKLKDKVLKMQSLAGQGFSFFFEDQLFLMYCAKPGQNFLFESSVQELGSIHRTFENCSSQQFSKLLATTFEGIKKSSIRGIPQPEETVGLIISLSRRRTIRNNEQLGDLLANITTNHPSYSANQLVHVSGQNNIINLHAGNANDTRSEPGLEKQVQDLNLKCAFLEEQVNSLIAETTNLRSLITQLQENESKKTVEEPFKSDIMTLFSNLSKNKEVYEIVMKEIHNER